MNASNDQKAVETNPVNSGCGTVPLFGKLSPTEAWAEIDSILDRCSPPCGDCEDFKVPLKVGCCAVSVEETVGTYKGQTLVLVRDVPKRLAMWIYLNIRKDSQTCKCPKFYEHGMSPNDQTCPTQITDSLQPVETK